MLWLVWYSLGRWLRSVGFIPNTIWWCFLSSSMPTGPFLTLSQSWLVYVQQYEKAAVSDFCWTNKKKTLNMASDSHHIFEGLAIIIRHSWRVADAVLAKLLQTGGHQVQLISIIDIHLSVLTGHQDKLFPWERRPLHNTQDLHDYLLSQVEILPRVHRVIIVLVNGVIQVSDRPRGTGGAL